MRKFLVLTLLMAASSFPASVFAQAAVAQSGISTHNGWVSVNVSNMPLGDVLTEISRQASFKLVYSERVVPVSRRVTINLRNVSGMDALAAVLKETGIVIEQGEGGKIILARGGSESARVQGIVTGRVMDMKTGKGISGVTVSLDNDTRGVSTDENGLYRLSGVSVGTRTVTVRLVGYAKQTKSVTVGEGSIITIDFKLEPSANVLDQVVVTGTVVQTELKAVPNAITVVTARDIEERGITRIDQLFRGDIPGLFAQNSSSSNVIDQVTMYSRGASALPPASTPSANTNPIKTYVDGIELANSSYLSQLDPKNIERIEILTGPQASTIYGSNAINGVMQIFTKRGSSNKPRVDLSLMSGTVENNFSSALAPQHDYSGRVSGAEDKWSYNAGGSWNYVGAWTPARRTSRTESYGGIHAQYNVVTVDGMVRSGYTINNQKGGTDQHRVNLRESGEWLPTSDNGLSSPGTFSLSGRTVGLTLNYNPLFWWSNEMVTGKDISNTEQLITEVGYKTPDDTLLVLSQSNNSRTSLRYTTTIQLPVSQDLHPVFILGADNWQSMTSSVFAVPYTLIGTLNSLSTSITRQPSHNAGVFFQGQIGILDALFLTYGLRAEWNPNYGDAYGANIAPRYGIAYTHQINTVTAKLRASYGRSTRPPTTIQKTAVNMTDPTTIATYGPFQSRLAAPELGPEYQQGGEGGIELYFGSKGSLVVTRYNQTVDGLIALGVVDSIRSLVPNSTTGQYTYSQILRNLNIGSLRNQGWELQGSITNGPFTARGTYSWTKSRIIGLTSSYQAQAGSNVNVPRYTPGSTFSFLPEHTWAASITYSRTASTMSININGTGFLNATDVLAYSIGSLRRLGVRSLRMSQPSAYRGVNPGYATADMNGSHRFTDKIEGTIQILNVGDFYRNDRDFQFATIGRQTKLGARIRM